MTSPSTRQDDFVQEPRPDAPVEVTRRPGPAAPNQTAERDDAALPSDAAPLNDGIPAQMTANSEQARNAGSERPSVPSPRPDPDQIAGRRKKTTVLASLVRVVATGLLFCLAILAAVVIWDFYVTAPWTRDGRIRVQVASIAPQVSGQITDLRVRDNQFVHKGDVLYVIDKFDYKRTLESDKASLRAKAADLQVKKVQAERRQHLSDLATTPEEQQQYAGNATQAQAAFDAAQQDVDQANVNLQRTEVQSPVNGFVTNLLMRVGDYAREGSSNISVIDADSYWVDGYFEETKMARVCEGHRAEAQLMGYDEPIIGRVSTVTRGISVSDAAPSTQGLPNVDPIYTWVRLAQRVPVRIAITHVPPGMPLVSGMTATVTIRDPGPTSADAWLVQRWHSVSAHLAGIVKGSQTHPRCLPLSEPGKEVNDTIEDYAVPPPKAPNQVTPGVAPGMTSQPQVAH